MVTSNGASGEALLRPFLYPTGVALIGASRDPDAVTARPARYLHEWGYTGDVFIVNPRASGELHGHPVVADVAEAGATCEVALVMVPADRLIPSLEACASAGIMHAVSIASGFEGSAGAARRADLHAFLASTPDFRLIGPNCAGIMSAAGNSILSFSSTLLQERMTVGRVGLVMQSGAIGNGLLLALLRRGAGIAHWISTGNEFDLGAVRLSAAMVDDTECAAVGMFLEGITDPEWLPTLGEAIARTGKPVVALRSGASPLGRVAAFGHTGRVIGDDEIARAALTQAGVRIVDTLEELCDTLTVLSVLSPQPFARKARVGVVTVSGGTGVIAADAVAHSDSLVLADLEEETRRAIEAAVGVPVPVANPYDVPVLGDPAVFNRAIRAMAEHAGCDVVLAIVSTLAHDYEMLSSANYTGFPPIVFAHLSPEERFSPEQARRLAEWGIATVPSPQNAIRAISDWAGSAADTVPPDLEHPITGRHRLGIMSSLSLVGDDVRRWMPEMRRVDSVVEAVSFAHRLDTAVAVKAEGSAIEHRTDIGAVRVQLATPDEVGDAYQEIASICAEHGDEVIVQAMGRPGVEVLVSVVRDPEVGVVAVCRPGGVTVELGGAGTTVFIGERSAWRRTLEASALGRLLGGYRGRAAADVDGFLDLVADLLAAGRRNDRIEGIECNPVLVHPVGGDSGRPATVIDLLIFVAEASFPTTHPATPT